MSPGIHLVLEDGVVLDLSVVSFLKKFDTSDDFVVEVELQVVNLLVKDCCYFLFERFVVEESCNITFEFSCQFIYSVVGLSFEIEHELKYFFVLSLVHPSELALGKILLRLKQVLLLICELIDLLVKISV